MLSLSEAAARLPSAWIAEGAEEHVPHRKVGIIEVVHPFLMMHAMALRALYEKTQPVRRLHIPVIEQFGQSRDQHCLRRGLRPESDQQVENRAREQAVGQ